MYPDRGRTRYRQLTPCHRILLACQQKLSWLGRCYIAISDQPLSPWDDFREDDLGTIHYVEDENTI